MDVVKDGNPVETSLGDKHALVVGLARQGKALARFLIQEGAHVTVTDIRSAEALSAVLDEMSKLPIRFTLGAHPLDLLDDADVVYVSGGVPLDIPLIVEARRRGIPISNDAALTLEHCKAAIVGITGSSGKTTTSAITGMILEAAGIPVHVGGNIGTPLVDRMDELQPGHWAVMELSSFQLELLDRSPHIAGVTNVTPNHLDRHGTMSAYTLAKGNIVRWQSEEDYCVLSADDATTGRWLRWGWADIDGGAEPAASFPLRSRRLGFSLERDLPQGAFLHRGTLRLRLPGQPERTIARRESLRLRGMHNVANLLMACLLAGLVGAEVEAMTDIASTFEGVPHRLEAVRRRGGVLWVNDSIATTPERSVAAMKAFDEPLILLAGGRDKKLPWDRWASLVQDRVRHLVVFGEAADLIMEAFREAASGGVGESPPYAVPTTSSCQDLREAVTIADGVSRPGDVVLLAPGGTSFDAYDDFVARGNHFRSLVEALEE